MITHPLHLHHDYNILFITLEISIIHAELIAGRFTILLELAYITVLWSGTCRTTLVKCPIKLLKTMGWWVGECSCCWLGWWVLSPRLGECCRKSADSRGNNAMWQVTGGAWWRHALEGDCSVFWHTARVLEGENWCSGIVSGWEGENLCRSSRLYWRSSWTWRYNVFLAC